ncbi:PRELI domain-containing protein 1, mitochondrial-like [Daphnia pulex]|uniref:PRELI/MSF1 domain-containing protein n=1 Tax=Daphnia pulex TaxID=6669 RepID=E9HAI8_DAPPU|nr:PRELI domain-containing protein 1, mitochondrial-like [Daphnia pulex]XP_046630712.1 PRELI domain-containing protein 1, mitochondrial-like [Daphnia pulicaria]EFX71188.1 hypothetical protein DAPPUDRAFT_309135 [Daphnia pulex]|eukprot:EFX71188.1 hypothetical protein DAPPUDRAFT_309135 [Daphnia pulex]
MKFYEMGIVLKHPWDQVVQSFWQRYPNPYSKHVLTEDTVQREVVSGKLRSIRFLTKTGQGPRWADKFVPHSLVGIIEESIVDPKTQTLTTYTRNIGYSKIVSITEKVEYHQDPTNPQQTIVQRKAWIESQFHIGTLRRPIEAFIYDRFKKNCTKASNGFQWVLSKMWTKEPVTPPVILNDIALEAARRATTIASHANVRLSS